ncbi:MAG: hypothetical protein AB7H97_06065 [Pseudobdellovibrionaceae bacterium]
MRWNRCLPIFVIVIILAWISFDCAVVRAESLEETYRRVVLKLPKSAEYTVPLTEPSLAKVTYDIEFGEPIYKKPVIVKTQIYSSDKKNKKTHLIEFFDRIRLKSGSTLNVGPEKFPLTCIYVKGLDNRFAGEKRSEIPNAILRIWLVSTTDPECRGPIDPNWPHASVKRDAWSTFLLLNIKDSDMRPIDVILRFKRTLFDLVIER